MREYSRIYPSFWTGGTGKKLKSCGKDERIVSMYILTSPHSNMIGLYYLPVEYISYETALTKEEACKALQSLSCVQFSFYDHETEFIWVPEMAKYQIGKSLKPNDKQVKGIMNLYNSLPDNPFLYEFYRQYCDAFHMEEPRGTEGSFKGLVTPYEAMQCNATLMQ